ncbi:hypothetical protein [Streptomyces sp. NWU339]|uniref:hypothetical protein n=1 Tax=Streptomyces sp. NWU339 TaxID=2185284 RepID=UPI0015E827D8|nr:hypothetical protein [Streptomyces sp. NWU339]
MEPAKRDYLPHIPIVEAGLDAEAAQTSLDRLAEGGVPGRMVLRSGAEVTG